MAIHEIKKESDVNETLDYAKDLSKGFKGAIVLAIREDNSTFITRSTMSEMEVAYLFAFFTKYMSDRFELGEIEK